MFPPSRTAEVVFLESLDFSAKWETILKSGQGFLSHFLASWQGTIHRPKTGMSTKIGREKVRSQAKTFSCKKHSVRSAKKNF